MKIVEESRSAWLRIDQEDSTRTKRDASEFISLTEYIEDLGYNYLGSSTDKKMSNPKPIIDRIRKDLEKANSGIPITNSLSIYYSFHERRMELRGIFGIGSWGFIFIPGATDASQHLTFRLIDKPYPANELKTLLDWEAKKWNLEWKGDTYGPMPYRKVSPTSSAFSAFAKDLDAFLDDFGTARM